MKPTEKQQTKLSNMWPERADKIRQLMSAGLSYSKAEQQTFGLYDTVNWGEISSRLWRTRGSLLKVAATLCLSNEVRNQLDSRADLKTELLAEACEIRGYLRQLIKSVAFMALPSVARGKLPSKTNQNEIATFDSIGGIIGAMKQARRFVSKNAHDVPLMTKKINEPPTLVDRARICVEGARISAALDVIELALDSIQKTLSVTLPSGLGDPFGAGKLHSSTFKKFFSWNPADYKLVVTHTKPDADAIVGTWLADRFIFPQQRCLIRFVSNKFDPNADLNSQDCVVDVGRIHDPDRRLFDHRPPYFEHRDDTCATKLVLNYIKNQKTKHGDFESLATLVHDGDAASRRSNSDDYKESNSTGLHVHINLVKELAETDMVCFRAMALWLDALHKVDSQETIAH